MEPMSNAEMQRYIDQQMALGKTFEEALKMLAEVINLHPLETR